MSTTLSKKSEILPILNHVVESTLGKAGFAYLSAIAVREVLEAFPNSLNVDISNRDKDGNVAVKATDAAFNAAFGGVEDSHIAPAHHTRFEIEDGITVPAPRRGIQNEPRYPFALLNVGQSFFVPATDERPNPVKALASTVSSANKRMERIGKKFVIRADVKSGVPGARIWRSE